QPAHAIEEAAPHQVAAIRRDQRGQAEVEAEAFGSGHVFGTALFKRLGHVGHQPDAKAGAFGDDLDDVAPLALPFPPMLMHVQRNAQSVLTDKPEAGPKIGMGLCRRRDLADTGAMPRAFGRRCRLRICRKMDNASLRTSAGMISQVLCMTT